MSEIDRELLRQLSQMAGPACPPIKALGDLIDNQLSRESKESLELHLQGCPACINRLVELRELSHLQTAGAQPRAALVEAVKSMVRAHSISPAPPSILIRIKSGLSWMWAPSRAYVPLGIAGAAAAALLALVLVRSSGRVSLQSGTQVAQRMVAALAPISGASQALNSRVLSALELLPKTLILEETRGATDAAVYRKAAPATVLVITDAGLGSGVVISSAGDILTNYHVIRGAKRVAVVFKPQRGVEIKKDLAYAARPIKVDEEADLALLKVAAPTRLLHPLPFAVISRLQVGDDVHAIGHSEGEVWTYTTGTISRILSKYQWKGKDGAHQATVIQTQTAINPGDSGGPLLNNAAQVIGINSFRIEAEGLNYAIGSDTAEGFLQRAASGIAAKLANANGQLSRLEPFGDHVTGAYMKSSKPPPDVWLVHNNGSDQPLYAVTGSSSRKRLDTVFKGTDPDWKGIVYYFDVNCDGVVDLIGYSPAGSDTIISYQRPQSSLRLDSLAGELVKAFSDGSIPYRQVRFCN